MKIKELTTADLQLNEERKRKTINREEEERIARVLTLEKLVRRGEMHSPKKLFPFAPQFLWKCPQCGEKICRAGRWFHDYYEFSTMYTLYACSCGYEYGESISSVDYTFRHIWWMLAVIGILVYGLVTWL